ncbi:hypothetical protein NQZ68_038939 [Dissostichus eleginoides]|nr:hypothetical protein NQZ68_038939 [Dissostichus eleginoides]
MERQLLQTKPGICAEGETRGGDEGETRERRDGGTASLPAMPTLTPSLCPLLPSTLPPACHLPASLHGAPILAAIPPFLPLFSPSLPPHPGEGPALPYIQRAQQAERNPRVYKLCQASRRRCDPHREGK